MSEAPDNGVASKSIWDHESDKELLLAIIDGPADESGANAVKKIGWPAIVQRMHDKGYTFTTEGCRQHFMKIRKAARAGGQNAKPIAGSPRKRASNGTPKAAKSTKGNKAGREGEGDADSGSPTKKRRAAGKAKKTLKVGNEENEGDEDQDEHVQDDDEEQ